MPDCRRSSPEHGRPSTGEVIRWLFANTARALQSPSVRDLAEQFAESPASEHPFSALTEVQRARVAGHFAGDNRALAERFGFDASALGDRGGNPSQPARELFVAAEAARLGALLAATASRAQ